MAPPEEKTKEGSIKLIEGQYKVYAEGKWENYKMEDDLEEIYYVHCNGCMPFMVKISRNVILIYSDQDGCECSSDDEEAENNLNDFPSERWYTRLIYYIPSYERVFIPKKQYVE